ncbi:MAG: S41 family peptidase [Pseudomonadota bacterium]
MRPLQLFTLFIAILFTMTGPIAAKEGLAGNPRDLWLSADQIASDVALAQEAYSRIHPGYLRYADSQTMREAWSNITVRAEADGGMRLGDFYLAVQLALTSIRCDHTKAELPIAMRNARAGQPLYMPFRWDLIEQRGIITAPLEGTGLSRGEEIIAIDGRPLSQVVSSGEPYIPVDGFTDWARRGEITQSLEFMGGGVDHFGVLLWGAEPKVSLVVRNPEGNERKVTLDRISFEEWSALGDRSRANFADAVDFERIGSDTGYLRVDTFVNYRRPVDPHTIYAPIFESMANEGRTRLILDLRRNGGGSTDAAHALASYLIEEAMPLKRSMTVATLDLTGLREHLSTWDERALNPDPRGFIANEDGTYTLRDGITDDTNVIAPADSAFEGELIVLTSTANSSGSTNLLAILEQQERTTLIGEPTGGSAEGPTAGLLFTLTLPESGIRTRIPLFRYRNNVVRFEPGFGVSPDLDAPVTVAAFRAGTDPALELAKSLQVSVKRAEYIAMEEPTASISDFEILVGDTWSGELQYLNFGSDKRSTIPVRMVVREPTGMAVPYGFLYPGEEDKNASDHIRISRDGRKLNGFIITRRYTDDDGRLVIVTEGQGRDDNRPADIRLTYEIGEKTFVTRKDVRFESGQFINRNEYRMSRSIP